MLTFLCAPAAGAAGNGADTGAAGSPIVLVIWIAVLVLGFYFLAIKPQKKQQKQMDAMMSALEIGDCVVTTAGFYGVVIDIMEEVIVVEFGNNRNCRIVMKKSSIVEVEKPNGTKPDEKAEPKKIDKKAAKAEGKLVEKD